ncbi:XRE family transcriptional regulator [Micromonospora sp. WMMD718]|uniref:helix-turn-helix domain-containing protein n=1 Tax=unclassified Micromonospora TaxID=2617518 RepID=UPI00069F07F0|nr:MULTISPECIES: XRE family transcriptional regulator [unclassified Micromonospora]MDG4755734.1 XRE family transcriptional regulator [Micromonospora sp. WMMD718]
MTATRGRAEAPALAAVAFQPHALTLARRWRRIRKKELAHQVGVTATAVSQYELGQSRPSPATLARLALALAVPVQFFAAGIPAPATAGHPHFRSLRTTTQAERDQALAFGEIAWRVVDVIEQHLELPSLDLPSIDLPEDASNRDIEAAAVAARHAFGLGDGPVPHMVRLLEAAGVVVLTLPDVSERVDAFSHWYGTRPYVFISPHKNDKARSRMDAAHELAHLLLHHDAEPGSQILEREASAFGSHFLAPTIQLREELPTRLDFDQLQQVKRRWGLSLKALVYRGHAMGVYGDYTYRRAMNMLAEWGYPEPADLGAREQPSLLGKAAELLAEHRHTVASIAQQAGMSVDLLSVVVAAGSQAAPRVTLEA